MLRRCCGPAHSSLSLHRVWPHYTQANACCFSLLRRSACQVTTASAVGDRLDLDSIESVSYVGIYFIASQLLLIPIIYIFTRIDWRAAFEEGRLRWFRAT